MTEAKKDGWTVISLNDDGKSIFPQENKRVIDKNFEQ